MIIFCKMEAINGDSVASSFYIDSVNSGSSAKHKSHCFQRLLYERFSSLNFTQLSILSVCWGCTITLSWNPLISTVAGTKKLTPKVLSCITAALSEKKVKPSNRSTEALLLSWAGNNNYSLFLLFLSSHFLKFGETLDILNSRFQILWLPSWVNSHYDFGFPTLLINSAGFCKA